jgi:hypothetical protein
VPAVWILPLASPACMRVDMFPGPVVRRPDSSPPRAESAGPEVGVRSWPMSRPKAALILARSAPAKDSALPACRYTTDP